MARQDERPSCAEDDCTRPRYARGWCAMHFKRWQRTGSPERTARPRVCSVAGCERDAKTRGWCHAHYQRWRNQGDVRADVPLRAAGACEVPSCDRKRYARDLCATHYKRLLADGDPRPDEPIRVITGEGYVHHGYFVVPVRPEERWLVDGDPSAFEHRLVVARQLGRPLTASENVHHRNGDRLDNRPENLEIWSTSQPSGQRVADKVAHAIDVLREHRPELLIASERNYPEAGAPG